MSGQARASHIVAMGTSYRGAMRTAGKHVNQVGTFPADRGPWYRQAVPFWRHCTDPARCRQVRAWLSTRWIVCGCRVTSPINAPTITTRVF